MLYKVGDKVKVVAEKPTPTHRIGWTNDMNNFLGKELTISHIVPNIGYYVKENNWTWCDEYFVEEKKMSKAAERLNKEQLMQEGYDVLESCHIYSPTSKGMEKIWNTYVSQKSTPICNGKSVFDLLSNHPNYIPEKGYIVFSNDYEKPIDFDVIYECLSDIAAYGAEKILVPIKIGAFTYEELDSIVSNLESRLSHIKDLRYYCGARSVVVNGMTESEMQSEKNRFKNMINKYDFNDDVRVVGCKTYTSESYIISKKVRSILNSIKNWVDGHRDIEELVATSEIMDIISDSGLEIRGIREGQPLNKFIGKICREFGIDKWNEYNRVVARLGEAIKPITFTRHTIVSANWIDYWTMSFGDHWCSCANIDKEHYRDSSSEGMYGDGCCSSGTESYMLDPSTVVVYTVDKNYDGNDFELQDKINRCLFHISEQKFVMGRVYPQGTDGAEAVYKQWREMFQSVMSVCMDVPNYWKTEKDISRKLEQIKSYGTHYHDYEYSYCEIGGWSWNKPDSESKPNETKIVIGHNPICPKCGREHSEQENIQCCGLQHECYHCGSFEYEEDMHYIDGEWYCEDCCFFCEYHAKWEVGEHQYIEGYGDVCEWGLDNGDFGYCEHCGNYFSRDNCDYVSISDYEYCCDECAESDGYVWVEYIGEWKSDNEVTYCSECLEYVLNEDYNYELDMCNNCAEEKEEE